MNGLNAIVLSIAILSTSIAGFQGKAEAASSQAYNWRNVVTGGGGGFVPGIIFNKKEKDLIYARTDIGGAYRWNASTSTWTSISDSVGWVDWNKNGVDALATDPVDPNRLYMATGTYTNDWDTNGQIMRSTDRGNTWQVTALPFKVGGNMPGRSMGERLTIDPNKNNILYFGARNGDGLWKSTDYGVTWAKVTSFTNTGTYVQDPTSSYSNGIIGLSWITFDPRTGTSGNATQTIYVGVADKGNSVYRSTDGGATWAAVAGQPTGFIPHHGELSSTGQLYITYNDGVGPYDGAKGDVWKFDTATGVWTNISPVPSTSADNYYGYGGLALDAQHPNTLMVSTLNSWWPDANIFRSLDGGATWSRIWDWNGYPNRTLRYTQDVSSAPWLKPTVAPALPEPPIKLGWMIGDLEIDPFNSDRMMYGTGATIYGANNLTAWDNNGTVSISAMAKGIEETAVINLISPPSGAHLLSALGDISGFRHDDLTQPPAATFTSPTYATTMSIDFAELNPSFMVRVGNVDKAADSAAKALGISNDGGSNWFTSNSEPATVNGGGTVAVSANNSAIVWSTSDAGVFYTTSSGNSWSASTGVPAKAIVVSDRVNGSKFYAFSEGKFYVSSNSGATFVQTATTVLPTNVVSSLLPNEASISFKAVPGHEGDIWFAGGNSSEGKYGLWHSTNSGTDFTKITNVQEADLIGYGMAAPGQSYVALYTVAKIDGVRGVFRSDDAGVTWVRINDDLHQYARINMSITGDPRVYGRVYLGTNGRGILVADPTGITASNSTITPTTATFDKKTANQANIPVTLTLNGNTLASIKNGATTLVSGTDYTVSGSTVTILKSYLAAQAVGTTTLTFSFSAGTSPTLAITVVDTTAAATGSIKVQMYNGLLSASSNTIAPRIKLVNTGTTAVKLSDVKLRYYYTIDGEKTQNFFCDWSQVGSSKVTGAFTKMATAKTGADYYLEIGFTNGAGSLAAGQSIDIQSRISKSDWTNYTQTGDYSFDTTDTAYVDWTKMTGYVSGSLQWGIEP